MAETNPLTYEEYCENRKEKRRLRLQAGIDKLVEASRGKYETIVVTPATLRAIRFMARMTVTINWEPVKPAHIAEALAAALGFRTNAALVAWMGQQKAQQTEFKHVDKVRFAARLQELEGVTFDEAQLQRLEVGLLRAIYAAGSAAIGRAQ